MSDNVEAGEEDVESGDMVDDEEDIVWVEDKVVQEVHEEVSRAEFENCGLRVGVWGGEGVVWLVVESMDGHESGWGAVSQGCEAASGEGAEFGFPAVCDEQVGEKVDEEEC